MTSGNRGYLSLAAFVAVTAIAAGFGGMFLPGPWYAAIAKPSWTPPNWLFGPVWTILYIMIAVAGWLVWRARGWGPALKLWAIALVLNAAWSYLFFGREWPAGALVDIVALLLAILGFIVSARMDSRTASWLFVPYLLWVGFATALNGAIWQLN